MSTSFDYWSILREPLTINNKDLVRKIQSKYSTVRIKNDIDRLYFIREKLLLHHKSDIIQSIKQPNKGQGLKVLHLGAGEGSSKKLTNWIFGEKAEVVHIDSNAAQLEKYILNHTNSAKNRFVLGDIADLANIPEIQGETFDLIFLKSVIHHLEFDTYKQLVKTSYNKLNHGGKFAALNMIISRDTVKNISKPASLAVLQTVSNALIKLKDKYNVNLNNQEDLLNNFYKITGDMSIPKMFLTFMTQYMANSLSGKEYRNHKVDAIEKMFLDNNITSMQAALKQAYNVYSMYVTSSINNPEDAIYNIQNIEDFMEPLNSRFGHKNSFKIDSKTGYSVSLFGAQKE